VRLRQKTPATCLSAKTERGIDAFLVFLSVEIAVEVRRRDAQRVPPD